MKITRKQLKKLINEEMISSGLNEALSDDTMLSGDVTVPDHVDGEVPSGLPENIMTVAKMMEILKGLPGEMPVAYWHEFGVMNVKDVEVSYNDRFYKPEDYGGDWHDGDNVPGPEFRLYDILIIG
tara:strand:- start:762 stop:1136 length:375 start_codon:yes stop_codon:yes gene_type:complete